MKSVPFVSQIHSYLGELKAVIDQLNVNDIESVIHKLIETHERNGFIYIFGNGGSASTASHFVNDFNKGVSENLNKKFRFTCLNDNVSTVMAVANDIGYDQIFRFQLENYLTANDLVIGISGSGNSKNVIEGIEYANQIGAGTVALVGYDGGRLKQLVQQSIHVPVNNMQMVEDLHMVMDHLMMTILKNYLERVV
ncbi:phosphoheptose isomerase [Fischerella thermalis CCMEE 5273]|nr:phosphoheptose isomerase [Fischerella thermalis CCMEE 5273]